MVRAQSADRRGGWKSRRRSRRRSGPVFLGGMSKRVGAGRTQTRPAMDDREKTWTRPEVKPTGCGIALANQRIGSRCLKEACQTVIPHARWKTTTFVGALRSERHHRTHGA